ncbi:hypothetical protein [Caenibacillus caldisaponilyticus]|uniref:hypothetical protein n=1 Tax=Caenibacillus caldisaponilyticus TaxID=1674942 RepID=UPI0009883BC8|nr:hypothetical protein [Caenibacillus caldisaponilyticus]
MRIKAAIKKENRNVAALKRKNTTMFNLFNKTAPMVAPMIVYSWVAIVNKLLPKLRNFVEVISGRKALEHGKKFCRTGLIKEKNIKR